MLLGKSETVELLRTAQATPSKRLGQNFLIDPNVARRIVRLAQCQSDDSVLEIGPGVGALTGLLAAQARKVTAVEFDKRLVELLIARFAAEPEAQSVSILQGDALTIPTEWFEGIDLVVSNLPYNISVPVIMRILGNTQVERLFVMTQKEVAERFCASPRTKAYGEVTVRARYFSSCERIGDVSREVFYPKPKVSSTLIQFLRQPPAFSLTHKDQAFELMGEAFRHRRKMLRVSLASWRGGAAVSAFEKAGVAPTARPEELSIDDWGRIAQGIG